jgi:pyruvate,water dikinase
MRGPFARLASSLRRRRDPVPGLEARVSSFREVLHANNAALGAIAEIQRALDGEQEVTAADVRRQVTAVAVQTFRMISNLNRLTGGRHRSLLPVFDRLRAEVVRRTQVTPFLGQVGPVVPLDQVRAEMAEVVGQKSAFLGEAQRVLGGHVPEGFAISSEAYRQFMGAAGLGARVAEAIATLAVGDVESCFRVSARITQMIEAAPIPESLAATLAAAAREVGPGRQVRFAVRSSALQEGGMEMSFAGQYRSLLNVRGEDVADAFRSVLASKYAPQAISYRLGRGCDDDEVAMCCCVVEMIDAVSAGVLYSACQTEGGTLTLLQAVRGLGLSAVNGSAAPESVLLDPRHRRVAGRRSGRQSALLRCAPRSGTVREEIEGDEGPVVTDTQALEVAELAWRIEAALGEPLDLEWAIDRQGRPWVLQVRPQPAHAEGAERPRRERQPGTRVLVNGGARVSGGAASGEVRRVESDLDILRCPPGSVIVTSEANPRLAVLLQHAAGIVADMGEVTSHLATVAREFHVPALFATGDATARLVDGSVVTVDAEACVVYEGRVEAALEASPRRVAGVVPPHLERLAAVAPLIVPLTLRDRLSSGFSARRCRSLHDVIRFCHQATVEAMFDLGDRAMRRGAALHRLVSEVPIDCRVLDLGGGLRPGIKETEIEISDVLCRPMLALWRGLTDPRLSWRKARPVSLRGFASALVNYNFDQDQRLRAMGEPSYAFVTSDYLSLNSRIGYHFSTFDARVGEVTESNYASFRFVGGSTGVDQRSRRAVLIQRLLAAHGFETDCRADLVNARIRHRGAAEMDEALEVVGRVSGFVNHLDMALTSDALVYAYEKAYLAGDFGFHGENSDGPARP